MLRRRPIARRAVRTAAVVGTAAAVGHHAATRSAQQQAAQQAPPEVQYVEAEPAGITPDAVEQLKQLAGLKDQGILYEEEFAAEKAKILGEG
jgi:hypothetical protein